MPLACETHQLERWVDAIFEVTTVPADTPNVVSPRPICATQRSSVSRDLRTPLTLGSSVGSKLDMKRSAQGIVIITGGHAQEKVGAGRRLR